MQIVLPKVTQLTNIKYAPMTLSGIEQCQK